MDKFIDSVRRAMEEYFGEDARRISHAAAVAGYARELLSYIDADETVTMAAAYLHDIGIPEAERKYGSSARAYQELEGPPVARELLDRLGASPELVETVCALIGAHHTPNGIDSPEFRILWDADALVNLAELLPGKQPGEVRTIVERSMVTEPGFRRALALFSGNGER